MRGRNSAAQHDVLQPCWSAT